MPILKKQYIPVALVGILTVMSVAIFGIYTLSSDGFYIIDSINALFLIPLICLMMLMGAYLAAGASIFRSSSGMRHKLTAREKEIVEMIVSGKKNQQIADALFVEVSTIKTHINNIYSKLAIKNRKELISLMKRLAKS